MFKLFKKWWKYIAASGNEKFNEKADPKVQLKQAMDELYATRRKLVEHAANILAQEKVTEVNLNRALDRQGKLNGQVRQAVKMAAEARKNGDVARALQFERAAETLTTQLIAVEAEVEDLTETRYTAVAAAQNAKEAVEANKMMITQKEAESKKLLNQLEQAKMQEQLNKANASLSETLGEAVPTLEEVRQKIEHRAAKAKGMSELIEDKTDTAVMEVTAAAAESSTQARLDAIRREMGLDVEDTTIDTTGHAGAEKSLPSSVPSASEQVEALQTQTATR